MNQMNKGITAWRTNTAHQTKPTNEPFIETADSKLFMTIVSM